MAFAKRLQSIAVGGESLRVFVPDPAAVKKAFERGEIPFPYWSQVWPAAKALAQFIHFNPELVRGKKVLELGAGLGLPSLVAARYADYVWCTDYVADATAMAAASAAHLQLQNFAVRVVDWRFLPADLSPEVLLLSDVNYDPAAFATLQSVVATLLQRQSTIILGTPQRLLAKDFVAPLLPYCTRQEEFTVLHDGGPVLATVLVLQHQAD